MCWVVGLGDGLNEHYEWVRCKVEPIQQQSNPIIVDLHQVPYPSTQTTSTNRFAGGECTKTEVNKVWQGRVTLLQMKFIPLRGEDMFRKYTK